MNRNTGMNAGQVNGTMNGQQVIGLDIAKKVFQLHTVDMDVAHCHILTKCNVIKRIQGQP